MTLFLEILAICALIGTFGYLFSVKIPQIIVILLVLCGIFIGLGFLMGIGFKLAVG